MKKLLMWITLMVTLGAFGAVAKGNATLTLGFQNITANNVADAAAGEAQLSVVVSDPGGDQVLFTFHNDGPAACSITDVYFRDGDLITFASLIDEDDGTGGMTGVDFSPGANPPELPGAGGGWTSFFTTDSDSPIFANGVNNGDPTGEWLGVLFDLDGVNTYGNVITALQNHTLEIGLHVQGFDGGGSESFVNNGDGWIPAPGAVLLGGIGVCLVGWLRRRRTI